MTETEKYTRIRAVEKMHEEAVELGRNHQGSRRFTFRAIAIAAALALTLGTAPLVSCASPSAQASTSESAQSSEVSQESAAASNSSMESPAGSSSSAEPSSRSASGSGARPSSGASASSPSSASSQSSTSAADGPQVYEFDGAYEAAVSADAEDFVWDLETISAWETGHNAVFVANGGLLSLSEDTLEKTGSETAGYGSEYYGTNSIALAANEGSALVIGESSLNADSEGSSALFATDSGAIYADDDTLTTTGSKSHGMATTFGGTIVAGNLDVATQGEGSAAVSVGRGGGAASLVDSNLSTTGSNSPLLYSTGSIELAGVTGSSASSQIALMNGNSSVILSKSSLKSALKGSPSDSRLANGVTIYRPEATAASTTSGEAALFQASDSKLESAIGSGALFYITNTAAQIWLSDTDLKFDSETAKLLVAKGDDSDGLGTAGSDGATAVFTGSHQTLVGDVEVDTISSVDFYLLDESTWTGSSSIDENNVTSTEKDHLNVYIGPKSTWVVTSNATVSNLSIEKGGKLVDAEGDAVRVADRDGNVIVEGTSDVTVTVSGNFTDSFETIDANAKTATSIDRATFDGTFETSTAF